MFNRGFDGSYGTHPLDKYDSQAQEPEYPGFQCANCADELQLGVEAWRYEVPDSMDDIYACTVGCMAVFCTKYDVDIDEFEFTEIDS